MRDVDQHFKGTDLGLAVHRAVWAGSTQQPVMSHRADTAVPVPSERHVLPGPKNFKVAFVKDQPKG